MRYIPVRLIRKPASELNGLDLSRFGVGDVMEVPGHTALMLMGEGWAVPLESAVLTARDISRPSYSKAEAEPAIIAPRH
jgi:hypothetical protein